MNASLWQLAGWTMIHSLWLGAAVALAGGFLRLACRRASPNARYAISLATLALLAATPIAAAGWLSVNGVPQLAAIGAHETNLLPLPLGEGWGEGQAQVHALNHPSLTLPLKGSEPEVGSESPRPAVIDLAQATPAELDALAAQQQSPQIPPTNTPPPLPLPPSALPLHPSDHQSPITSHLSPLIPHLPTLWLIGAPLTFTLLATGLVGSERLRRRATPLLAGPAFDACQRLRQTLTITRRVALAVCDDVAQPILVGIVRPLILLPAAALAGWSPEQLDMVLLHELAHVRRWDNLVNLLQRIVESLLFFHPAVWLVSRQVRRDREECCDAAVIRHTDRPEAYATLLIDIASRLRLSGQLSPAQSLTVASAMASHPLAGRIRRILNIEAEPMRITRRTLAATLLLPLLLAGAIFYSGASAEDSPPVKPGSPGSPNQGGAATESISEETQSTAKASSGSAAPVQEPEPSAKSGENGPAPESDADSYAANYPIKPDTQVDLFDLVRSLGGHNLKLDMVAGEWVIMLNAPKQAHNRLKVLFGDPTLPQAAAAPSSSVTAAASGRPSDNSDASADIANLQKEIRKLTDLIAKAQKEIINSEVAKQLAILNSGTPATVEAAVKAELERDSTIDMYKSQLSELTSELQTKSSATKNADDAELKRLRSAIQQTEAQAAKYRSDAERAIRDKLARTANDMLSAEIAEHRLRRMGAEVELAEYQQRLVACKQKLEAINAQPDLPQAIGTYATPTIAAAQAVQQQISDKQQPAQTTILDALENAKSPAEQQAAFTQLDAVFAPSDANPPTTVTYDAPAGDNMRERIERIFEGLEKDPYGPQISPSTRRWLNDDRNIEITAPRRAHDLYLHDFFHHLSFFAQIRDVVGEPLPKDETATGENSPQPPNQSHESTENLKLGHKALAGVIADAQGRFERQLAELQQRTAGREQTETEVALASALKSKILGMQVLEANRKLMQTKRLEDAGAPSSLNLRAAATGSDAYDTQPTANASPNSAYGALIAPLPDKATHSSEIARLESQVAQSKKEIAQLTVFDQLARINGNPRPHFEHVIREVAQLDPAVETAIKQLDAVNEKLRSMASGTTPLDDQEVRQLQRQRQEATEQLNNAKEQFVEEQLALISRLSDDELRKTTTERRRRLDEASKELATYQLDLKLATMIAGTPDSPIQGAAAIGSNDNAQTTVKFPPTRAKPASDFDAISVIQAPISQKTSIFGGTVTTAYLKVKFDRLRYSVDAPNGRLSPQEIERNSMNCIALIRSPSVLKAALKSFTPQAAHDMWQDQAVVWLQDRLSTTFPGHGEILELKLEGGDGKEDAALLQAIIDAFLARMKAPPESPVDPNAATKLNENAADALDPFANLAPSSSPDEVDGPPTTTYLYDGKTFDQWRDLWKLELNPERRTEAINALAAFGRTGHGQEAADAILEVAGEYGDDYSRGSPEGKLLEAIRLAVSRMPASQWMPQVQQRIAAAGPDQELWIRHAGSFLGATRDSSEEARQLAAKFAEIAGDELLTATALYLWRNDQDYAQPQTIEIMRRALQQDPPGIDIAFLGFQHLDKVPEQLDVLLRSGHARRRLEEHAEKDKGLSARLSPALLEVLQNPDRANDHVGALRALRALATARRSLETTEDRLNISKELIEQLRTAPDELLPAALVTGAKLSGFADNEAALKSLQEQGLLTPERIEHLRNLDEQSLFEEANAE